MKGQERQELPLNNEEAAKLLGISPGTLNNMRTRREGPSYFRIGRVIRYWPSDIMKYINKNSYDPERCYR